MNDSPYITPARRADPQYAAAFHIFSHIGRGFEYVTVDGIEKAQLLNDARAWSHGESIMLRVAMDLFDPGCVGRLGHEPANPGEIATFLDCDLLNVVFEAIEIARGGMLSGR